MKFSVIIPLFNKEKHIKKTLRSVLLQTDQDYEVIIIDDGSTDQSLLMVKEYLKENTLWAKKIKLIEQKNLGVSSARNKGIENAKGEYLSFLDADDVWYPHYLETIRELIERYPEAGFYVTAYRILLPKGHTALSPRMKEKGECVECFWRTLSYGRYDFVWTSVNTMKTKLVEQAGLFREGERIGQDLDLWARAARINPQVAYSSRICADYQRDAQENARKRVKIAYAQAFMRDLSEEIVREHSKEERKAIQSKYDRKMMVYLFTCMMEGEKARAKMELNRWKTPSFIILMMKFLLRCCLFLSPRVLHQIYKVRLKWY